MTRWLAALAGCLFALTVAHAAEASRIRALLGEDRWPEALEAARAAHAADATDGDIASALAEALFRAGKLDECETLLGDLLSSLPESAEPPPARALATLARLRAARGRRGEAGELLERALSLAPDDREVLYWAGDLAAERARGIELLVRYLAASDGDDPDRVESARGAVRFMRQLGERQVWVSRASPARVELPLTQLWDASGRTLGYVVEARLSGKRKPVRLLLDTGSHGLFLIDRIARKRGFVPLSDKTLYGGGGDGRHATRRGVLPALELGGLRFADALATTTAREFDPTGRFHGLLGIAIFGGYRVTLDLAGKRLLLEQAEGELPGADYWWISGQLLTRATAAGESGLFVLDSGATNTVLADATLERVRGEGANGANGIDVTVRSFGGNVAGAKLVRGVTVDFQGLQTADSVLTYDLGVASRIGGVEVSGLLGLDLLGKQRVVIDTRTQRIAINP